MMKLNKKVFYGGAAGALMTVIVLVSILVLQPAIAGAKSASPQQNSGKLPAASLPEGLYPADRFEVLIDGIQLDRNIWYVSGIEWNTDVRITTDTMERKNATGQVHYAPKGITIRGAYHNNMRRWFENYNKGTDGKRAMSIIIYDATGAELLRYNCFEIWPSYYRIGPLSTGGSSMGANAESILEEEIIIQVEKIELA